MKLNNVIFYLIAILVLFLPSLGTSTGKDTLDLHERIIEFTAKTENRKVTGVPGMLFGHFSERDHTDVMRKLQQSVVADLRLNDFDMSRIQILPIVLESAERSFESVQGTTKRRLLGGLKNDVTTTFVVKYKVRIQFLYPSPAHFINYENKGAVDPSFQIQRKVNGVWETLATLNSIPPEFLSLDAIDEKQPTKEVASLTVEALHKKYRFELGSALAEVLPNAKKIFSNHDDIRVVINFNTENWSTLSQHVVVSTDVPSEKNKLMNQLGISGTGRYFSRYFYSENLKKLQKRLKLKADHCTKFYL